MKGRTKGVLLIGGLAVAIAIATVGAMTAAVARVVDPHDYCGSGFSRLVDCTYHWSSTTTGQSMAIFATPESPTGMAPSHSPDAFRPISVDVTSWAIVDCPRNYVASRLLCADGPVAAPVQAASDDLATGLPRPKPWLLTTAKSSPFAETVHVETPLDLASVLGFYRAVLSKRGWTENGEAAVEPDRGLIVFTTSDGPALLRLSRQNGRTVADLTRHKPAANAGILPKPGQVRLLLGNTTDEEAVITINEQTIALAAGAGRDLTTDLEGKRKSSDGPEINLPPGKYNVSLKIASGAVQSRELEIAADETWGLLAGPAGLPLPIHLY